MLVIPRRSCATYHKRPFLIHGAQCVSKKGGFCTHMPAPCTTATQAIFPDTGPGRTVQGTLRFSASILRPSGRGS
jgi:hypothetical protein